MPPAWQAAGSSSRAGSSSSRLIGMPLAIVDPSAAIAGVFCEPMRRRIVVEGDGDPADPRLLATVIRSHRPSRRSLPSVDPFAHGDVRLLSRVSGCGSCCLLHFAGRGLFHRFAGRARRPLRYVIGRRQSHLQVVINDPLPVLAVRLGLTPNKTKMMDVPADYRDPGSTARARPTQTYSAFLLGRVFLGGVFENRRLRLRAAAAAVAARSLAGPVGGGDPASRSAPRRASRVDDAALPSERQY